jgi:hypothetical protein
MTKKGTKWVKNLRCHVVRTTALFGPNTAALRFRAASPRLLQSSQIHSGRTVSGGGKMARFGEQVGGVPESLGPTKRGGRGRSIAVIARRRDKLGWSGQGGGHREICFPAEGLKETRQVKVEGKVLWGR